VQSITNTVGAVPGIAAPPPHAGHANLQEPFDKNGPPMRTIFQICFWLVVCFAATMWAFHIFPNLRGRADLLPTLVVETVVTLGTGFVAVRYYDRHALVRLLLIPFGVGLMAIVHGLFFFTDGAPDAGLYLAFGALLGVWLGVPLGIILALISWIAVRLCPRSQITGAAKD